LGLFESDAFKFVDRSFDLLLLFDENWLLEKNMFFSFCVIRLLTDSFSSLSVLFLLDIGVEFIKAEVDDLVNDSSNELAKRDELIEVGDDVIKDEAAATMLLDNGNDDNNFELFELFVVLFIVAF
jgi:hypothetical protein